MNSNDIMKAEVVSQLRAVDDSLRAVPNTDTPTVVNPALARRLQALLLECGETIDSLVEKAAMPSHLADIIHQGQFQVRTTGPLLKALEKLAPKLNTARSRTSIAWISVEKVEKLVGRVRKPLEDLYNILRENNSAGSEACPVNEAQRIQLIALLKSLLAELEGPYVDRGRVAQIRFWLGKLALKAAETAMIGEMSNSLKAAASAISELFDGLQAEKPSSTSLDEDIDLEV